MQFTTFLGRATLTLAVGAAGALLTSHASAQSMPNEPPNLPSAVPSTSPGIPGLGLPLTGQKLAVLRGGFDTVNNDMQLSGSVANNSAVNVASGNNYIADGSFTNMTGLPVTIQNSGSNVLIQNATIVNVQFK